MPIVAIGLNHRTCAVDIREKLAFSDAEIPAILSNLRARGMVSEAVILSTCNRVELYAVTPAADRSTLEQLRNQLAHTRSFRQSLGEEFYLYQEPQSLEHLFKVACGLDSMVLGETEILGQLKKAYDLALQHKLTGGR